MGARTTTTLAVGLVVAAGTFAPSAQAAPARASFTGDLGCSSTTLGRAIDPAVDPRPVSRIFLTGEVTGLTSGTYYVLQVPGSTGESAGAAALGTASAAGTVRITGVELPLSPSSTGLTPVPYGVFSSGGAPETRVASGTVPVHVRSVAGCSSLYRLASGPFSTQVPSYGFNLQPDGNIVERVVVTGRTLWTTGTVGHPGARAVLQSDGNLVVRDTAGRPLWNSGTAGHPGSTLTVQTDSNVVLRDSAGRAVWSTGIHR